MDVEIPVARIAQELSGLLANQDFEGARSI